MVFSTVCPSISHCSMVQLRCLYREYRTSKGGRVTEYRSKKNGLYSSPRPQAEDLWLEYRPFFSDLYSGTRPPFDVLYSLYRHVPLGNFSQVLLFFNFEGSFNCVYQKTQLQKKLGKLEKNVVGNLCSFSVPNLHILKGQTSKSKEWVHHAGKILHSGNILYLVT